MSINSSLPPYRWLKELRKYGHGPLDKYGHDMLLSDQQRGDHREQARRILYGDAQQPSLRLSAVTLPLPPSTQPADGLVVPERKAAAQVTELPVSQVLEDEVPVDLDAPAGDDLWQKILGYLRQHIDPHSFQSFLSPLRAIGLEGRALYVRVPAPQFKYVAEKYHDQISAAIRQHALPLDEVLLKVQRSAKPDRASTMG